MSPRPLEQTLARGAVDQLRRLEETSAAMEEMSSMNSRNAEHARNAAILTHGWRTRHRGQLLLGFMVESMGAMKASSGASPASSAIDEIAFRPTSSP